MSSFCKELFALSGKVALVTGGGAGIAHGRHIALDAARTPLCNLWLTLMRGVGLDVESHGDSTGVLRELI